MQGRIGPSPAQPSLTLDRQRQGRQLHRQQPLKVNGNKHTKEDAAQKRRLPAPTASGPEPPHARRVALGCQAKLCKGNRKHGRKKWEQSNNQSSSCPAANDGRDVQRRAASNPCPVTLWVVALLPQTKAWPLGPVNHEACR